MDKKWCFFSIWQFFGDYEAYIVACITGKTDRYYATLKKNQFYNELSLLLVVHTTPSLGRHSLVKMDKSDCEASRSGCMVIECWFSHLGVASLSPGHDNL